MKAVEINGFGEPHVLSLVERPKPKPEAGQVLIKVAAAGVNRPDCFQRAGHYPPPAGANDLPGLEVSGKIVGLGSGLPKALLGQRVMALVNGGGYAQYVSVDHAVCLPIPAGLGMVEAAAIPETLFTVWHNVFRLGKLAADDVFLVHGGASGIGTMAIQLAREFGARVFATAGNDQKCELCRQLGAEIALNYHDDDFVSVIKQATGNKGANVILDMVGGSYVARNHKAAAHGGRIVQIAALNGGKAEIDVALLMVKRLVHTGSTLRSQSDAFKAELAQELRLKVLPLIDKGVIKPILHSCFELADADKSHELMESGAHYGKIVLKVLDD